MADLCPKCGHERGPSDHQCPVSNGITCNSYQLAAATERARKAEKELADVRTLDEGGHGWECGWYAIHGVPGYICTLFGGEEDRNFTGPTPDAARHAAAEYVRGLLPDSEGAGKG